MRLADPTVSGRGSPAPASASRLVTLHCAHRPLVHVFASSNLAWFSRCTSSDRRPPQGFVPAQPSQDEVWRSLRRLHRMARSTTFWVIFGPPTLIIAISASRPYCRRVHRGRHASSTAAPVDFHPRFGNPMPRHAVSATGWPNATRDNARWHIDSSARSATPMQRMQCGFGGSRRLARSRSRVPRRAGYARRHANILEIHSDGRAARSNSRTP